MIVISGTIPIKADARDAAIAAAGVMRQATLQEAGCHAYQFSFALDDPNVMCIFEEWQDQAALDIHFASPHMADFRGQMGTFVGGAGDFQRYEISEKRPLFG